MANIIYALDKYKIGHNRTHRRKFAAEILDKNDKV